VAKTASGIAIVTTSPKAAQRFDIEERYEAGLVLTGSEVKALRAGRADLDGAYAMVERGELWLHKMHIGAYEHAGVFAHELRRSRKLLVSSHELERIEGRLTMQGYTLVPTKLYFKNGWAKVEVGLGRVKKMDDRRQELRKQNDLREARAAMAKKRR
jgi:SsrA-binding protein